MAWTICARRRIAKIISNSICVGIMKQFNGCVRISKDRPSLWRGILGCTIGATATRFIPAFQRSLVGIGIQSNNIRYYLAISLTTVYHWSVSFTIQQTRQGQPKLLAVTTSPMSLLAV